MLTDDAGEDLHEGGIGVRHLRADERHARLARDLLCLDIEVVEDLQVVGDEAGGADHDGPVLLREVADHVLDRRPEPRIRSPAGALPSDRVVDAAELRGDELRGLAQSVDVGARRLAE